MSNGRYANWHNMTPEQQAAVIEGDYKLYGFSAFDVRSGERVDPSKVKPIMEEHNMGDEDKFNPADFFEAIRKSASVKTGAIMFGQAQTAYYATLKEGMSEEEAYNMLAHTTEQIIRGIFGSLPLLAEVAVKAAALAEFFKPNDKQVPGNE